MQLKKQKKRKKKNNLWGMWAKALGSKASKCNKESDIVAIVRTIIFLSYLITNCFIVANAVRHWNNIEPPNNSQIIKNS